MLTLVPSETSTPDYSIVNATIKETFTTLDRCEWQAVAELQKMRDSELYHEAGYSSFREYCEHELSTWGGWRRINQLLAAKRVRDTVGELGQHITNERHARSLVRLLKEPEKLKEAVAIAVSENPAPSESDFAAAANKVVPRQPRRRILAPTQEPMVPSNKVKITLASHPRYGDEGIIEADAPNPTQQIVTFADGERELVNNTDIDIDIPASPERKYPPGYTEAIAQLQQQHQQELERVEQELRIRLIAEAKAIAEQQVLEELIASQQLFQQQKEQNVQLQQRLDEMEAFRKLGDENHQLKQRLVELENAVAERPSQQWGNTLTKQAAKALNKQVKLTLDQTIDLRSLAVEPPKENAQECLRLMGIALSNLATAMNNTQALQAAALILGTEPTKSAIAHRAEQLQLLPQAVSDIRAVLSQPQCTWLDYITVANEYAVIKNDYFAELSPQEIELITTLELASTNTTEPLVSESTPTDSGSLSNNTAWEPLVQSSNPTDFGTSSTNTTGEPLVLNHNPTDSGTNSTKTTGEPLVLNHNPTDSGTNSTKTTGEPLVQSSNPTDFGTSSTNTTGEPMVLNHNPTDSGTNSTKTTGEPLVQSSNPTDSNSTNCGLITVGSIVAHADKYSALYVARGQVIEDLGDEVWVAWDHWKDRPKKTDRYFKNELRLI